MMVIYHWTCKLGEASGTERANSYCVGCLLFGVLVSTPIFQMELMLERLTTD